MQMLHTIRIAFNLQTEHIRHLQDAYGIDPMDVGRYFGSVFDGKTVTIHRSPFNGNLSASVIADIPELLRKGDITEQDYSEVKAGLTNLMEVVFGDRNLYRQHRLMRVDYRYDVVVKDPFIRQAYVDLFSKSYRKKGRRLKKMDRINIQGIFEEYDTGLEHVNDSVETTVYDKEAERLDKNMPVKEYEKDVLRFEVRLKEDFLAHRKRYYGIPRSLEEYFSEKMYKEFMSQYILETYLSQDFMRFSSAINVVEDSAFTNRRKKAIAAFLRTVSRGDLSSPQKSMSPSTFKNRLTDCEESRFHPITIPNYRKDLPDLLVNPLASLEVEINKE